LFEESQKYENLVVQYIPGIDPVIMFYDAEDTVVEKMSISKENKETMHELLTSKGINLKPEKGGKTK